MSEIMNDPILAAGEAWKAVQESRAAQPQDEVVDPLTEKEAIEWVQRWVTEDEDVDITERRTVEEMIDDLEDAGEYRTTDVAGARFRQIVSEYAPNAPRKLIPSELASLAESGVVYQDDGFWVTDLCRGCGKFGSKTCCGQVDAVPVARTDGKTLTARGRQLVGLDPLPPKIRTPEERAEALQNDPLWSKFRGVGELQGEGTPKMYVENFLPEGVTLICGLPKEGKSWLALALAKALTSGKQLFGQYRF